MKTFKYFFIASLFFCFTTGCSNHLYPEKSVTVNLGKNKTPKTSVKVTPHSSPTQEKNPHLDKYDSPK